MNSEQLWIFNRVLAISILYALYRIARPYFRPLPPNPSPRLLRKLMVDRMRNRRGAPRLCLEHSAVIRLGQMAILDHNNCEICVNSRLKK